MTEQFNVLGICGSLRRASMHGGLLRAFARHLGDRGEMLIADLADIPLYDADIDGPTQPAGVVRLKEQIRNANLLVIASPEYNGSFSGVLKNAIDWATRPVGESAMAGQLAVVMTSAGRAGGVRGIQQLRQVLFNVNTNVMMRPELNLALARTKFSAESGDVIDDELHHEIANFVDKAVTWGRGLGG